MSLRGGLAVAYSIVYLLPIELLASGNSAQVIAMIFCILIAAIIWNLGTWYFGLPVSTTQILSSAVAGTAVANKSGLKAATIKYIALAWLFTFPVAMILSGGLYVVVSRFL